MGMVSWNGELERACHADHDMPWHGMVWYGMARARQGTNVALCFRFALSFVLRRCCVLLLLLQICTTADQPCAGISSAVVAKPEPWCAALFMDAGDFCGVENGRLWTQ